MYAKFHENPKG